MSPKPSLLEEIARVQEEIRQQQRIIAGEKKRVMELESLLISDKEQLSRMQEELRKLELRSDFESLRDTARDQEIARYRNTNKE